MACADAQALPGARPIAGIELFLFAVEDQAHRRVGPPRKPHRYAAVFPKR
jgi:hypothetical protein